MMVFIHRQYRASGRAARRSAGRGDPARPTARRDGWSSRPGINRAVVQAVNVGRSIAPDVRAVLISDEPEEAARVRERWERQLPDVPLVIVESPYRALVGPLLSYLDVLDEAWPPDEAAPITFVVIPEYVARHWWERCSTTSRRSGSGRPCSAAAHRRRERAVPARRGAFDSGGRRRAARVGRIEQAT